MLAPERRKSRSPQTYLRFWSEASILAHLISLCCCSVVAFWSHFWHGSSVLLGRCHRGADPLTLERNRDSSPREVSNASVAVTGSRLDERGRPRRHAWDGLSVEMTMGRRISCDLLPSPLCPVCNVLSCRRRAIVAENFLKFFGPIWHFYEVKVAKNLSR